MIKNRKKVRVGQSIWMSTQSHTGGLLYKPCLYVVTRVDNTYAYFMDAGSTKNFYIHKRYLVESLNREYTKGVIGIFTTYRRCLANCKRHHEVLQDLFRNCKDVFLKDSTNYKDK